MDVLAVLHDWLPLWSPILMGVVGWLARSLVAHTEKDRADHDILGKLVGQVEGLKKDLDSIKAGNVAEYQESISEAHTRYVAHGMPLTIASRGRVNAMMRSLSALDDEDGTFQSMVDDINDLPIFQPHEG